jgi:hypothetical protein
VSAIIHQRAEVILKHLPADDAAMLREHVRLREEAVKEMVDRRHSGPWWWVWLALAIPVAGILGGAVPAAMSYLAHEGLNEARRETSALKPRLESCEREVEAKESVIGALRIACGECAGGR